MFIKLSQVSVMMTGKTNLFLSLKLTQTMNNVLWITWGAYDVKPHQSF